MARDRFVAVSGIGVMVYAVLSAVTAIITGLAYLWAGAAPFAVYSGPRVAFNLVLGCLVVVGYIGLWLVQTSRLGKVGGGLAAIGAVVALGVEAVQEVFIVTNHTHDLLEFFRTGWFIGVELVGLLGPFVGLILSGIMTVRRRELGRWSFTPLLLVGWLVLSFVLGVVGVVVASRQFGNGLFRSFETTLFFFSVTTALITGVVWFLFGYSLLARRAPAPVMAEVAPVGQVE